MSQEPFKITLSMSEILQALGMLGALIGIWVNLNSSIQSVKSENELQAKEIVQLKTDLTKSDSQRKEDLADVRIKIDKLIESADKSNGQIQDIYTLVMNSKLGKSDEKSGPN